MARAAHAAKLRNRLQAATRRVPAHLARSVCESLPSSGMDDGSGESPDRGLRLARDVRTAGHLFVEQMGALSDLASFARASAATLTEYADPATALAASVAALSDDDRKLFEDITVAYSPLTSTVAEVDEIAAEITAQISDKGTGYAVARSLRLTVRRPSRQAALYNSIITGIAAAFEGLISNLASAYYQSYPRALQSGEKEQRSVDAREVLEAGTLDELVERLVERRIEALMFGRIPGWRKFFKHDLNAFDFEDYADSLSTLRELFERRNAVLHNGGIVTSRYARVARQRDEQIWLRQGQRIHSDSSYVTFALEHVAALGGLLVAQMYDKFQANKVEVRSLIAGISGDLLFQGRALACHRLYDLCSNESIDDESSLITRVNWWLARRRLGERETVLNEVQDWDVTSAATRYQMAKLCLLEQSDDALALIETLLGDGQLTLTNLNTWPLFDEMRDLDGFRTLVSRQTDESLAN